MAFTCAPGVDVECMYKYTHTYICDGHMQRITDAVHTWGGGTRNGQA